MKTTRTLLGLLAVTLVACGGADAEDESVDTQDALWGGDVAEGFRVGTYLSGPHRLRITEHGSGRALEVRLLTNHYAREETVSGRATTREGAATVEVLSYPNPCALRLDVAGESVKASGECRRLDSRVSLRGTFTPVRMASLVGVYGDPRASEVVTIHEASEDGVRFTLRSRGDAMVFRAPWSGPLEVRATSGACTVDLTLSGKGVRLTNASGACPAIASSAAPLPRAAQ